ncbi:MAG TPA: trypsin-like serine protease, partial [Acidobacteriota bacterium]
MGLGRDACGVQRRLFSRRPGRHASAAQPGPQDRRRPRSGAFFHPGYDPNTNDSDIALIHLAASASQQPILLNAPFVSPELSVNTELKTMDRVVSDSLEQRRFSMLLLAL